MCKIWCKSTLSLWMCACVKKKRSNPRRARWLSANTNCHIRLTGIAVSGPTCLNLLPSSLKSPSLETANFVNSWRQYSWLSRRNYATRFAQRQNCSLAYPVAATVTSGSDTTSDNDRISCSCLSIWLSCLTVVFWYACCTKIHTDFSFFPFILYCNGLRYVVPYQPVLYKTF